MSSLLVIGGRMVFDGNWWGAIPFIIGLGILKGLKLLPASPYTLGVSTLFGDKVPYLARGFAFTFEPFGFPIIGVVEIKAVQKNVDVKNLNIQVICKDGVTVVVKGSTLIRPREDGESLISLDNVGGLDGAADQLRDLLLPWTQVFATKNGSHKFITQQIHIKDKILEGLRGGNPDGILTTDFDDIGKLGIEITKFALEFERDPKVTDAENNLHIVKRIEDMIREKIKVARSKGEVLSYADARKAVTEDIKLINADIKIISTTGGARPVVVT